MFFFFLFTVTLHILSKPSSYSSSPSFSVLIYIMKIIMTDLNLTWKGKGEKTIQGESLAQHLA